MKEIGLIDSFMQQTLSLIDQYPDFEDEIKSSSVVVYIGSKPDVHISEGLDDEIKDRIKSIFESLFN